MRLTVVALVIGSAVLGACAEKFDEATSEKRIQQSLEQLYPKAAVTHVDCPKKAKQAKGATLTCSTTVDGAPVQASVQFVDDHGSYETVTLDKAVIDTATAQQAIADRLGAQDDSHDVSLDCGTQPYLIGDAGATFDCAVEGVATSSRLRITVTDVKGNLTTQLLPD
jgi:hypothetical protein